MSSYVPRIARIYDQPTSHDGYRILVDRLWPRGISRDRADIDLWLKNIAPSPALRTWWGHDPTRLAEFTARYREELDGNPAVDELRNLLREHAAVTLLYAAHDVTINHAVVLRDYLLDDTKDSGAPSSP